MRALKFLIEKEFKQIVRNPLLVFLILFFPMLMIGFLPFAIDFQVKNVKIEIIDHSQSTYSRRLISKIAASQQFTLVGTTFDYETAMDGIEMNDSEMLLEIPQSFESDLVNSKGAEVGVAVNSVNGTVGLLGSNYLNKIISDFSNEVREELISTLSREEMQKLATLPQAELRPQFLFNPTLDYKNYAVPSFIILTLTMICGILPALNIILEKEKGTIHQINVTPINKFYFILSKLIPYWIIGMIVMVISVAFAYWVFGQWPTGRLFELFFSAIIFVISISGMGIIVSNYSETLQQASFVIVFVVLVMTLLSGMFSPVSSMPTWAKVIAYSNPYTYVTRTVRMIYLNKAGLLDILPDLLALLGFAIVLSGWSVISYHKRT
ncbi:MAG: ABC transporter permease [Porphyromonas sp.]|nr:ABC transporter permease [Porphyromonas sp.]